MKRWMALALICICSNSYAQVTSNNAQLSDQEKIQQQRETDRNESRNQDLASQPNQKSSTPTPDVSKWGIDPDLSFQIENHLLGYSTIVESDQTLQGVKLTGLVNLAYYQAEKKTSTGRSKGRFVFGLENPVVKFHQNLDMFVGFGATMGDRKALYLDVGLDYHLLDWFKLQAGLNYNSSYGVAPQLSAGFVW